MNEDGMLTLQASHDFSKARGKALLSRIQHFLRRDKDQLLAFNDVKEILKPDHEVYRGMDVIPINLIVGSEGRYQDFTKCFFPKAEHLRYRWESVDKAHLQDLNLPPIQLYEIGGAYFVRDGNHRVSVAKAQGVEFIDAEITSLASDITIVPKMTLVELQDAVISFEKKIFYEKTSFGAITGCDSLNFSRTGRYDVIYNHILVHKYYMNENRGDEIPFTDALLSWYNNVYQPIIEIEKEEKLCALFPKRTESDLYVWIVKHWDFLKRTYDVSCSAPDAVRDWAEKHRRIAEEMAKS
ncbi:MAG: transcriptional regulator [Spirochaetaceae bacterium]|jgi:hypothetical protein|nr:transcriptional regulator [Spirochaetaceae bacterium]